MKNNLLKVVIVNLVLVSILSGCEKSGGQEYIGSWSGVTIEKNGELYNVINAKDNTPFPYCAAGASYKAGKLDCGTGLVFSYDAKNDALVMTVGLSSDKFPRSK